MGFWSFSFSKAVKIDDAFFGEMIFVEIVNDPSESYFECERYFQPSGEKIGLSVTGTLRGPTQRQKDLFTQVENDYSLLVNAFVPAIEERFGVWMKQPVIQDFTTEFKPAYLSVLTCDQQPIEWEITFDTIHDLHHSVTVGMLGYEPKYVRVDG